VTSRRKADELINQGRVSVNGRRVERPGDSAIWGLDTIEVDGVKISAPSPRTYIMLNKPFGYVSALSDPQGRPIVTDLLKDIKERIYPVGRLDFDSLGLLLLTNDGEWAHRIAHPRYHVPKTYKITLTDQITREALDMLRKGVELEDGFSGSSKVTLLKRASGRTLIRMTITRGKSRIVRRMVEAVGSSVVHLVRTGVGILELGDLKMGSYRLLETHDVEAMKKMVGLV